MLCQLLMEPPSLGMQGSLTIIFLAVFLHVNLVVAFGWLAVGVTVCRGGTEGLACGTALCMGPCPTMGEGFMARACQSGLPCPCVLQKAPSQAWDAANSGVPEPCYAPLLSQQLLQNETGPTAAPEVPLGLSGWPHPSCDDSDNAMKDYSGHGWRKEPGDPPLGGRRGWKNPKRASDSRARDRVWIVTPTSVGPQRVLGTWEAVR